MPQEVACPPIIGVVPIYQLISSKTGMLHVARFPLERPEKPTFGITIVHDLSFIDRRQRSARDYMLAFVAAAALLLILLAATSTWLILRGWVMSLIRDIRNKAFSADLGPSRVARDQVLSHVRQALREVGIRSSAWKSTFAKIGPRKPCGTS